ncbi:hypothetical protein [Thermoproteus tenax]|uniref:Uncharacterized protein n=1 Tax=Thermoproteus tenax (strain ATCC 35583 / DSM 2078 / JCM 9277 / NBRC 100435 / Kra 1) TaxID=768679 RepID=G4RJS5_THETK|nr:hypothetical protein [Thermoproteus tenax]CCC81820.1 hypothetical protein TTX_1180 [Thermoproteus tenax Kra 1]
MPIVRTSSVRLLEGLEYRYAAELAKLWQSAEGYKRGRLLEAR